MVGADASWRWNSWCCPICDLWGTAPGRPLSPTTCGCLIPPNPTTQEPAPKPAGTAEGEVERDVMRHTTLEGPPEQSATSAVRSPPSCPVSTQALTVSFPPLASRPRGQEMDLVIPHTQVGCVAPQSPDCLGGRMHGWVLSPDAFSSSDTVSWDGTRGTASHRPPVILLSRSHPRYLQIPK